MPGAKLISECGFVFHFHHEHMSIEIYIYEIIVITKSMHDISKCTFLDTIFTFKFRFFFSLFFSIVMEGHANQHPIVFQVN